MRKIVVLPDPEAPRSVKSSPRARSRSADSTAVTDPYLLVTFRRRIAAAPSFEGKAAWESSELPGRTVSSLSSTPRGTDDLPDRENGCSRHTPLDAESRRVTLLPCIVIHGCERNWLDDPVFLDLRIRIGESGIAFHERRWSRVSISGHGGHDGGPLGEIVSIDHVVHQLLFPVGL